VDSGHALWQAHHERNQYVTVRPEPVEGLNQRFLKELGRRYRSPLAAKADGQSYGMHFLLLAPRVKKNSLLR
jgi:hypothetical protein